MQKSTLRPSQKKWMEKGLEKLKNYGAVAYLIKIGMGKTITSLFTGVELYFDGLIKGICIIVPNALIPTWKDEIEKHVDTEGVNVFVWTNAKTKKFQRSVSDLIQDNKFKIFIVNVELFQTKQKDFFIFWESFIKDKMVIIDESGKIKNVGANRTNNIIKKSALAPYKSILTGTEIETSVLDLFTQFEFLKHDFWNLRHKTLKQRFYVFRAKYMILKDMQVNGRPFKIPVRPKPHRLKELYFQIDKVSVRPDPDDYEDLPEVIYQEVPITPNKDQLKVYQELKNQLFTEYKGHILTVQNKISLFTRFQQISGGFMPESGEPIGGKNPKFQFIVDDSEDFNGKIIIWGRFRAELEYLHRQLYDSSVMLIGGLSDDQVAEVQHEFKNNPGIKYFIANPSVGAYGLNLQFAHLSYYFSNVLSPAQRIQSEGRTNRSGQTERPIYKDLLCSGMIDGKILRNIKNHIDLSTKFQNLGTEEFIDLF